MPPDNDALGLYRYVGSLTHPVRYHSKTIFYPPLQLRRQSRRRVGTLVAPYSGVCEISIE